MVRYESDVANATYIIKGNIFFVKNIDGVIGFPLKQGDADPRYMKLLGNPGEPVRDEVERVMQAVIYMQRGSKGMSKADFEEAIAHILGMKYGMYQEKKKKGEIEFV